MSEPVFWGSEAAIRRVAFALVISACGHAALLANAAFVPAAGELSLFSAAAPLRARLSPPPAPSADDTPADAPQRRADTPPPDSGAMAQSAQQASPSTGLPGVPLYYRSSELDERAMALNVTDVEYPERALAERTRGVVTLRLLIDDAGTLREASVVDAQPAGVFENAALDAVRSLRFRPAIRHGVAVGSIKLIEVPFDPDCTRTGSCIQ